MGGVRNCFLLYALKKQAYACAVLIKADQKRNRNEFLTCTLTFLLAASEEGKPLGDLSDCFLAECWGISVGVTLNISLFVRSVA